MVYFILCDGGIAPRYAKIGCCKSEDVEQRLRKLQTGCPYPLRVIFTIEGDHEVEKAVHRELRLWHRRGEWYEMTEQVLAWVNDEAADFAAAIMASGVTFDYGHYNKYSAGDNRGGK